MGTYHICPRGLPPHPQVGCYHRGFEGRCALTIRPGRGARSALQHAPEHHRGWCVSPRRSGGEDAAFGAELAGVRGILAHLFPPRGERWSSPRPAPATPSQSPARHCSLPGPFPIRPRRHLPPPPLGNGDGRNYWNSSASRSAHATGNRCAARERWHPWICDSQRGADGIPKGVVYAVGARAPCAPTMRLGYSQSRCTFSWPSGLSEAPRGEDRFP